MTLKSPWSITSDDENSRQSFLSDCDSEFDLNSSSRYSPLNKLSINCNEPPITRSRAKANGKLMIDTPTIPKELRRSTIRHSIDSITEIASTFTNSIIFPKQESSDNRVPTSPIDGVNTLADCFESCSLDENKFGRNSLWPSREPNSQHMRPIISSSISKISPLFFQSTSTTTLFGQQQAQLWSGFRFAASTIRNNLSTEQLYSTPFNSSNNHFFNQSSMLSSPQIVPSSSSSFVLKQHPITNSAVSTNLVHQQSSSKIFFTLIIFAVGLVLGYLLTHTFPPDLIRHWFVITTETSLEISLRYLHFFYDYLQIVMNYFSSNLLA